MQNKPCWISKLLGINLAHNKRILKIALKKNYTIEIFFLSFKSLKTPKLFKDCRVGLVSPNIMKTFLPKFVVGCMIELCNKLVMVGSVVILVSLPELTIL